MKKFFKIQNKEHKEIFREYTAINKMIEKCNNLICELNQKTINKVNYPDAQIKTKKLLDKLIIEKDIIENMLLELSNEYPTLSHQEILKIVSEISKIDNWTIEMLQQYDETAFHELGKFKNIDVFKIRSQSASLLKMPHQIIFSNRPGVSTIYYYTSQNGPITIDSVQNGQVAKHLTDFFKNNIKD